MDLLFSTHEFELSCSNTGNQKLRFIRPADPNEVLNTVTDEQYEKDRFLPYWAELWPSSLALFNFVLRANFDAPNRIIEFGCGLGHISSALAFRGFNVQSFDISPLACKFAHQNITRNSGKASVFCSDWRFLAIKPNSCDLIIASDILYEKRWIEPVLTSIEKILSPDGKVIIADPCRRFWDEFKGQANQRGFRAMVVAAEELNEGKTVVEILQIEIPR